MTPTKAKRHSSIPTVIFAHHVGSLQGGAERSFLEMIKALSTKPVKMIVLLPTEGELKEALSNIPNCTVYLAPFPALNHKASFSNLLRILPKIISVTLKLLPILNKEPNRILHANTIKAGLAVLPAKTLTRTPLIWHCRDLPQQDLAHRIMAKRSAYIIAISNYIKETLIANCPPPSATVLTIPNCINASRLETAADLNKLTSLQSPTITMLATYVPWKRQQLVINVINKTLRAFPKASFVFAGTCVTPEQQVYKDELLHQVRSTCKSPCNVHLLNNKPVSGLLCNTDLLVHPADKEPFGRVVAEALIAGIPVITSNHGGAAEISSISSASKQFCAGSIDDLSNQLLYTLHHLSEFKEIARGESSFFRTLYHPEKLSGALYELYQSEHTDYRASPPASS